MRGKDSLLSRAQRLWAWVGFLALAGHSPLVAWALPDDTWLLSITVALLLAMVILIDDRRRHRPCHPALGPVGKVEADQ